MTLDLIVLVSASLFCLVSLVGIVMFFTDDKSSKNDFYKRPAPHVPKLHEVARKIAEEKSMKHLDNPLFINTPEDYQRLRSRDDAWRWLHTAQSHIRPDKFKEYMDKLGSGKYEKQQRELDRQAQIRDTRR